MFSFFSREGKRIVNKVDQVSVTTLDSVDNYVLPVRKTIFQRFPVVFSLLVTTGATAMFLGIEQTILKYQIFNNQPELILLFGVSVLAFTGKLYKKLG